MSVSLIDRLIEPMKDYISFRDFIFRLSSINNEPLYEVVTYLLHHDLDAVAFYNIDTDYKIIRFSPYEFDTVAEFLKEIQKALSFSHEEWVWSHPTSLSELRDQDRRALTNTISKAMHCFFKKSELLSFEPLNGLLHFDGTGQNQPASKEATQQEIGKYQRLLITYKLFTPDQLVCLLIDENPACISHNDEYHACCDMVSTALDANELTPINEKYQIKAEQVKEWLASNDFIYKGFNDHLTDVMCSSNKDNVAYQNRIAELEQQLADKEANASFMMGSPTVEQGEPKDSEQIISDLRDRVTQLINDNASLKNQLTQQAEAPTDDIQLQGIAKYNADKAYVISTAKALANYIWSMDTNQVIRTGDMVQQVRHVMHSVAPKLLPDDDAIRQWLSSIAPDYAKKGGKAPKDAPSEIPLIMKK